MLKITVSLLGLLSAVLSFTGCASTAEKLARQGTVIPLEGGLYVASGSYVEAEYALKIALASAEQCCLKQGKRFVVVDTKTNQEDGLVSDKTADVLDIATNVAATVGGIFSPVDGSDLRGTKYVQIKYRCE